MRQRIKRVKTPSHQRIVKTEPVGFVTHPVTKVQAPIFYRPATDEFLDNKRKGVPERRGTVAVVRRQGGDRRAGKEGVITTFLVAPALKNGWRTFVSWAKAHGADTSKMGAEYAPFPVQRICIIRKKQELPDRTIYAEGPDWIAVNESRRIKGTKRGRHRFSPKGRRSTDPAF